MGLDVRDAFPAARAVFEEIDEALERDLSGMMFHGDAADLRRTDNAQLAVFALSAAMLAVLRTEGASDEVLGVRAVLGHSLGHFSAAHAAGVLPLAAAAHVVRSRGEAMRDAFATAAAASDRLHAMVAALPLSHDDAVALVAELEQTWAAAADEGGGGGARRGAHVCAVANVNSPTQVVLSGYDDDVAAAVALGKASYGVRRALPLDVGAPFHCALMAPAAEALRATLDRAELAPPRVALLSNVTGVPLPLQGEEGGDVRQSIAKDMVRQLTAPVLWSRCVASAAAPPLDCVRFIELGGSGALGRLVKQCVHTAQCDAVGDAAALGELLRSLEAE